MPPLPTTHKPSASVVSADVLTYLYISNVYIYIYLYIQTIYIYIIYSYAYNAVSIKTQLEHEHGVWVVGHVLGSDLTGER